MYIIGKLDDGSTLPNTNTIKKKRHSSSVEGRNKILKTEKSIKNGNNKQLLA